MTIAHHVRRLFIGFEPAPLLRPSGRRFLLPPELERMRDYFISCGRMPRKPFLRRERGGSLPGFAAGELSRAMGSPALPGLVASGAGRCRRRAAGVARCFFGFWQKT